MNTSHENEVAVHQLEALVEALRKQATTLEKCIEAMKTKKLASVLTSNWKSSGDRAVMLLQRFVKELPGAIETDDTRELMARISDPSTVADKKVRSKRQAKRPQE